MTKEDLINNGVRTKVLAGTDYFYVTDITEKMKEYKVDSKEIMFVGDDGLVTIDHIHPLTDFDRVIKTALNFNPKNK